MHFDIEPSTSLKVWKENRANIDAKKFVAKAKENGKAKQTNEK